AGPALFGMELLSATEQPVTRGSLLFFMLAIFSYGLFTSTMHLGKPHRFYRAFNNLKYSPISREVASVALFFNALVAFTIFDTFSGAIGELITTNWAHTLTNIFGVLAMIMGPVAIYTMHKVYRIQARPYWNHYQTLTSFVGNTLTLGSLMVAVFFGLTLFVENKIDGNFFTILSLVLAAGLVLELLGLYRHKVDMKNIGGEGEAAMETQLSKFGKTYNARNLGLATGIIMAAILPVLTFNAGLSLSMWLLAALIVTVTAVVGRAMFYVMVIPTTMPGAFFWRNNGFQEHARSSGLAQMPQAGVLPKTDYHHETVERAKREIKQELRTIREKGIYEAVFKRIKQKYF
ncbi:MAG: dimethyl sulfoxide reductase anchor subunit, partial [Gammaproteobacteria bacterium]|nr:dimethyl sulfoxide reductase anchor subunit [Gammaproteobacteria bacterium]